MGTRETERNGVTRGSISEDEEEAEEKMQEEGRSEEVVTIHRTLRSTIVKMGSDEAEDEARPLSPVSDAEMRGDRRRRNNENHDNTDPLGRRNANSVRVSSDGDRERDGGGRFSRDREKDGGGGRGRVRDSDRDREVMRRDVYHPRERQRGRGDENRRESSRGRGDDGYRRETSRGRDDGYRRESGRAGENGYRKESSRGRGDGYRRESSRGRDDGSRKETNNNRGRDDGFRKEITTRRDTDRLPEDEHRGGELRSPLRRVVDLKGKEKLSSADTSPHASPVHQPERGRQREGGSQGRMQDHVHNNSRKERDDSPSSDSRDAHTADVDRRSGVRRDDEGLDNRRGRDFKGDRRNENDRARHKGETAVPELYSIHRAIAQSVRHFGIFVRLDGFRNDGLVHLSQVSDHEVTKRNDSDAAKVEALSSVVGEGEVVWVKVISVKTEDDGSVKVGCSIKYVSQRDGRDLDPNNLQLEKLQPKPAWQAPKKLELEAVYNVICTRCGGHGHLRKECYSSGDKSYELLKDEDDNSNPPGGSKGAAGVASKTVVQVGQSSKLPPSGPVGRGRLMVQPAWMKHGVGVLGDQEKILSHGISPGATDRKSDLVDRPEKVTTMQEALAILASSKEEKRKRREDRRHRKHGRREKRHGAKEGRREKHRKRHRSDDDFHKSRKKQRV